MNKNPIYGFEKAYFENIKNDISNYAHEAYFDNFNNLILKKNSENKNAKTILVGAYASENSFLITDISPEGEFYGVSLFKTDETIKNNRVVFKNKLGFIKKDGENLTFDFGFDDKKSANKLLKCGDTLYIKATEEILENYIYTNEKAYSLKNIIAELLKNEYSFNIIFVLFREKNKGAYALGKNIKSDMAFFLTFCDNIKADISYLKKEKNYISEFRTDEIPPYISEEYISYADSYYLAGGSVFSSGIAIKSQTLQNGIIKFPKNTALKIKDFLESI